MRGPARILRLQYSEELDQVRQELCATTGASEVSRQALCRMHEAEFRRAFVDLMASLNEQHRALTWTLMPFTSKNPLTSDLCRNAFYTVLIARLLAQQPQTLWVLTHSTALASQVVAWGAANGVTVVRGVGGASTPWRVLKRCSPAAIVLACIRTVLAAALARALRPGGGRERSVLVVMTTMPQSSVGPAGYRDAYFAPLTAHLARSGERAMTFALVFSRTIATIWRLRRAEGTHPVVPVEACLTVSDIAKCVALSLRQWATRRRLDSPAVVCGVDVRPLLQSAIDDTYQSGGFFRHYAAYLAARNLTARCAVTGWIYPFENRALERAVLLGARDADRHTRLIGCQNAALTPSHLNFMLGRSEAAAVPLPDAIFTTGDPVREWLVAHGNFPSGLVRVGCAFRQGQARDAAEPVRSHTLRRVLVVLASGIEEYVEMLAFVADAFCGSGPEELRFRPHPEFPFAVAERLVPASRGIRYDVSTGSLQDDLRWADVVVYASSTVSMEAVARGIPVIHADVGHALNADPLADRTGGLRWAVARPADVLPCLRAINSLSDAEYRQRALADRDYVDRYFLVPDEDRIRTLLEAVRCRTSQP